MRGRILSVLAIVARWRAVQRKRASGVRLPGHLRGGCDRDLRRREGEWERPGRLRRYSDQAQGYGVRARNAGGGVGILGFSNAGSTGVRGEGGDGGIRTHSGDTGIGVHGRTGGVGSAVYGEATVAGVGVFGDAADGTGVLARSTSGLALDVRGKAKFSRSGQVTVAEGRSSTVVNVPGVTTSSIVLVLAQTGERLRQGRGPSERIVHDSADRQRTGRRA